MRDLEDELVHAFTAIAGLVAPRPAATAALRTGETVASGKLLIAGMNLRLAAALTVVKNRLINVPAGDTDVLAMLDISDRAVAYCFLHGLFDVRLVAPQKPLPVYGALVLAI